MSQQLALYSSGTINKNCTSNLHPKPNKKIVLKNRLTRYQTQKSESNQQSELVTFGLIHTSSNSYIDSLKRQNQRSKIDRIRNISEIMKGSNNEKMFVGGILRSTNLKSEKDINGYMGKIKRNNFSRYHNGRKYQNMSKLQHSYEQKIDGDIHRKNISCKGNQQQNGDEKQFESLEETHYQMVREQQKMKIIQSQFQK